MNRADSIISAARVTAPYPGVIPELAEFVASAMLLWSARREVERESRVALVNSLPRSATAPDMTAELERIGSEYECSLSTDARRKSGSHYTPHSLTAPIVAKTLEPLLACLGPERTADQVLSLHIADPAMGAGAFVLESCRALAREVVAAWERHGELGAVVERHGDAETHARRLVAAQCIYGLDKNPGAVKVARNCLWRLLRSSEIPETICNQALLCGDALVGLSLRQISRFHWRPPDDQEPTEEPGGPGSLGRMVQGALHMREMILARDGSEKWASAMQLANVATDQLRMLGDVIVGAFFTAQKKREREVERKRRLEIALEWIRTDRRGDELHALSGEARAKLSPFHWWVEFPEVFFDVRQDPLVASEERVAA